MVGKQTYTEPSESNNVSESSAFSEQKTLHKNNTKLNLSRLLYPNFEKLTWKLYQTWLELREKRKRRLKKIPVKNYREKEVYIAKKPTEYMHFLKGRELNLQQQKNDKKNPANLPPLFFFGWWCLRKKNGSSWYIILSKSMEKNWVLVMFKTFFRSFWTISIDIKNP